MIPVQIQTGERLLDRSDYLVTGALYLTFALTGLCVVLPGTLLPMLSVRWQMGDGRAGMLFLFFSCGSSIGALLARGHLARTLAAGCLLTAIGAAMMGRAWNSAPLTVVALYGCGLGLSMTTISLLQSRRRSRLRVAEMARLNLIWAAGACAGPSILLHCNVVYGTGAVLGAVAVTFCLLAGVLLAIVPQVQSQSQANGSWLRGLRAVPLWLLVLIPLTTGIESGVGGWLSSYTTRTEDLLSVTISATTAFWAGLMLSRLYHAKQRERAASRWIILRLHPWLIVAGLALLIGSSHSVASVCAAFLVGAGVGPLYPLLLALLLDLGEASNAGFLMAGLGASTLPMLTGLFSSWTHTLRAGLGVLFVAGFAVCILAMLMANE